MDTSNAGHLPQVIPEVDTVGFKHKCFILTTGGKFLVYSGTPMLPRQPRAMLLKNGHKQHFHMLIAVYSHHF